MERYDALATGAVNFIDKWFRIKQEEEYEPKIDMSLLKDAPQARRRPVRPACGAGGACAVACAWRPGAGE